jgi:hypothetical protein
MGFVSEINVQSQPAALEIHAANNLQFIRDTMERAAPFTVVPGAGGAIIGVSALAAGFLAHSYPLQARFWIWLVEGCLAAGIGMGALYRKSKRLSFPLTSRTAKRALFSFATPLAAAAMLTLALYRMHELNLFAGLWLLLYGVAVITAGAFSVRVVPLMGLCFMALGSVALLTPYAFGNLWMTAGFGGFHLIFGALIARNHGG